MIILEPAWKSYVVQTTEPVFSIDECNKIIKLGRSLPKEDAKVGSAAKKGKKSIEGIKNHKLRRTDIAWLPFKQAHWVYSRLEQWMHTVNNRHMGFDQLQIGEYAQFTMYSKNHHYDWHTDNSLEMSNSPPVRKMSMITLLNDPKEFKGGELEIFSLSKKISLKQGHALCFASFVGHRSLPVTQGTKLSMPIWFNGQPFK